MILHQWTMVLLIAVILLLGGVSPAELGIRLPADAGWSVEILLILLAAVAGSGLVFRWKADRFVRLMLEGARAILPATTRQRWGFVALAVGAGISEELVFRGFLIYYLALYFPRWPLNAQVLATAAVFGCAHVYQGWRGIAGTGILGAAFALLYLETGSLLVPIVTHTAIDLRVLLVLTPERMRLFGFSRDHQDRPSTAR